MKLIIFFFIVFTVVTVKAQENGAFHKSVIYLVRHAEKEKGNDPVLTSDGKRRAGELARVLKKKKIKHIYVTQYLRTQMTADSLRIQLAIDTVHYHADTTGNSLLEEIKAHQDAGKNLLIIGHSNTLPVLLKKLGVQQPIREIADNEFDNLFIVQYKKGKATLSIKKYGAKPQKTAAKDVMQPVMQKLQ